jgi:hypothetical protein
VPICGRLAAHSASGSGDRYQRHSGRGPAYLRVPVRFGLVMVRHRRRCLRARSNRWRLSFPDESGQRLRPWTSVAQTAAAAAVVTLGAYVSLLGWDQQRTTGADGHLHGPYEPWQVVVLVLVLAGVAVWAVVAVKRSRERLRPRSLSLWRSRWTPRPTPTTTGSGRSGQSSSPPPPFSGPCSYPCHVRRSSLAVVLAEHCPTGESALRQRRRAPPLGGTSTPRVHSAPLV